MKKQSGWSAMTQFIYGDDLSWSTQQVGGQVEPTIYGSKLEVQKEIAEIVLMGIEAFLAGERDYEDVQWEPDHYPVYIEVEDGQITCWIDETKGCLVWNSPLSEWLAQL